MKKMTIYKRKEHLYFVKDAKYTDGWVRSTMHIEEMNEAVSLEILTETLMNFLNLYEEGLELNKDYSSKFTKTLTKKAKCKSYKQFVKESIVISVIQIDIDEFVIQPLKPAKTFKGYESYKSITLTFTKEELLNNTLIKSILDLFQDMEILL